jgi:hypothetical protein
VKSLQTTDDRRRTPSDGNSSHGPLVGPGELKNKSEGDNSLKVRKMTKQYELMLFMTLSF